MGREKNAHEIRGGAEDAEVALGSHKEVSRKLTCDSVRVDELYKSQPSILCVLPFTSLARKGFLAGYSDICISFGADSMF